MDGTPLPEVGIAVTVHKSCHPFASTTHVVPPAAALGMGCRKNKESEAVENVAFSCLKENDIYPEAVAALASIDVKKEEPGFWLFQKSWEFLSKHFPVRNFCLCRVNSPHPLL